MSEYEKEKRRHKRHNIDGIHGNMLFSSDISIVNISLDGVAVETTKRLNINKDYMLKISYKSKVIKFRGRVVWSILHHTETQKTGEMVPVYRAGLRFMDLRSDTSNLLLNFIDENKIKPVEKRILGVRFKIKQVDDVKIDYPYEYNIKRMSLSGMLVESENLFDVDSHHEMEIFFDNRILSVVGRIVNCVEYTVDNINKYDIGIEFINMADEDRDFLEDFFNKYEGMKSKDGD